MSIRNNVSLIGNLGAAPNVTTTPTGTKITDFSLATNEYFRDRDGKRQTRTMWHRVKAFGKVADILGEYLVSGSQVAIEGRISYNKWIDKHDQVRINTEIIVEDFTFLSSNNRQADNHGADPEATAAAADGAATTKGAKDHEAVAKAAAKPAAKVKPRAKSRKSASATRSVKSKAKHSVAALVEDDDLPF